MGRIIGVTSRLIREYAKDTFDCDITDAQIARVIELNNELEDEYGEFSLGDLMDNIYEVVEFER